MASQKLIAQKMIAQKMIAFIAYTVIALSADTCLKADDHSLQQRLMLEQSDSLAAAARQEGDARRGAIVFHRSTMTCAACHSVNGGANSKGPDLAALDKKTTDAAIVESILEPSKTISPDFATVKVEMVDGLLHTGLPVEETAEQLVLRDAANPDKLIKIKKQDIEASSTTKKSIMPEGQINLLSDRRQFLDLVRYLIELRDGGVERAVALQPSPPSNGALAPEEPLPWKPVVQRGEVSVVDSHIVRGLAIGFADGTILYDADQLTTAAVWFDGFVKSSSQTYFGLYWHQDGGSPEKFLPSPNAIRFQFPTVGQWLASESTATPRSRVSTSWKSTVQPPNKISLSKARPARLLPLTATRSTRFHT